MRRRLERSSTGILRVDSTREMGLGPAFVTSSEDGEGDGRTLSEFARLVLCLTGTDDDDDDAEEDDGAELLDPADAVLPPLLLAFVLIVAVRSFFDFFSFGIFSPESARVTLSFFSPEPDLEAPVATSSDADVFSPLLVLSCALPLCSDFAFLSFLSFFSLFEDERDVSSTTDAGAGLDDFASLSSFLRSFFTGTSIPSSEDACLDSFFLSLRSLRSLFDSCSPAAAVGEGAGLVALPLPELDSICAKTDEFSR